MLEARHLLSVLPPLMENLVASDTATASSSLSLTAAVRDPADAVTAVAFYRDANGDAALELFNPASFAAPFGPAGRVPLSSWSASASLAPGSGDQLLGIDTDGTDGWSAQVHIAALPPGTSVFFAQGYTAEEPIDWVATTVQAAAASSGSDAGSAVQTVSSTAFYEDAGDLGLPDGGGGMYSMSQSGGLSVDTGPDTRILLGETFYLWASFEDVNCSVDQVSVDWADGSSPTAYDPNSFSGSINLSHYYSASDDYTLTVTVHDELDNEVSASCIVSVHPTNLSVDLGGDAEISAGDSLSCTGYIQDSYGSEWSVTADYGDGSTDSPSVYDDEYSNHAFDLNHQYSEPGDYTVTVTIDSDYPDSISASLQVTVIPAPPEVTLGDEVTIALGAALDASGYFTVCGSDWSVTADYGDGSSSEDLSGSYYWDEGNSRWAFDLSHAYWDFGHYVVTVTVVDQWDNETSQSFVASVQPLSVSIAGDPGVPWGSSYTLQLMVNGPEGDVPTGWQIDWGDSSVQPLEGNPSTVSHDYSAEGAYAITATATDAHGTYQASPASGQLDGSFGIGGMATIPLSVQYASPCGMAIQPDGKIVQLARTRSEGSNQDDGFALVRFNANGGVDTAFGVDGIVNTGFYQAEYPSAVAIQSDGKIVVAGHVFRSWQGSYSMKVARYLSNGAPDPSFGGGGSVTTDNSGWPYDLLIQPDGKIVVAGGAFVGEGGYTGFSLVRYDAYGNLDPSFGSGGMVTTAPTDYFNIALAVAGQPDGSLVAAGFSYVYNSRDFALVRYTSNGQLDPAFGANGVVTSNFGNENQQPLDVLIQPDGKIIAAGCADDANGQAEFALARYTSDGQPDATFGLNGLLTTPYDDGASCVTGLILQPDGKIVATGCTWDWPNDAKSVMARYRPDGSLDLSFHGSGKVTTEVSGGWGGMGAALDANENIVVGGATAPCNLGLMRFNTGLADLQVTVGDQPPVIDDFFSVANNLNTPYGVVAHFSDDDPNATAADYTATIAWADGATSSGSIVANSGGGFDILGGHTYGSQTSESVAVTVVDSQSQVVTKSGGVIWASWDPSGGGPTGPPPSVDCGDSYWADFQQIPIYRQTTEILVRLQEGTSEATLAAEVASAGGDLSGWQIAHELDDRTFSLSNPSATAAGTESAITAASALGGVLFASPAFINSVSGTAQYVTDELIVNLQPDVDPQAFFTTSTYGSYRPLTPGGGTQYVATLAAGGALETLALANALAWDPRVEFADPNSIFKISFARVPNDGDYYTYLQWNLHGANSANLETAWDTTTGNQDVIIAVLDQGIDIDHPDLNDNIATITGPYGDTHGRDFMGLGDNDPRPDTPNENHGTKVAGVAAAVSNNGAGVAGTNWNAKILPVRVSSASGFTTENKLAEAVYYAAGMNSSGTPVWRGADVINCSWGGPTPYSSISTAFERASVMGRNGKGSPIFVASGNDASGYNYFHNKDHYRVDIPAAGMWQFIWEYKKNAGGSSPDDTVWLANVHFPDGTVQQFNDPSQVGGLPTGWSRNSSAGAVGYWSVVDDLPHAYGTGRYELKAGPIPDNGWTNVWTNAINVPTAGLTLTFDVWVSSASGDKLDLYLYNGAHWYSAGLGLSGVPTVTTDVFWPANLPSTIAVGASSAFGYRSDYSRYGNGLDFVAPGGDGSTPIITTAYAVNSGGTYTYHTYDYDAGTSFAAPLAAGVGALLLAKNPDLTAQQVRTVMQQTADQIGGVIYSNDWNQYYGYGRLNAAAALDAVPAKLYWDPNGDGAGVGGNGEWNTTSDQWRMGSPNYGTLTHWYAGSDAVFAGTGGYTVGLYAAATESNPIYVNSLSVETTPPPVDSNQVTLSNSPNPQKWLRFAAPTSALAVPTYTGTLFVPLGATLRISSNFTAYNLFKRGAGALFMNGTQQWLNGGMLYFGSFNVAPENVGSPNADGTYAVGDTIYIDVTFDQEVDVIGMPQLLLATGGTEHYANYQSKIGTSTLRFVYIVHPGDENLDLDYYSTSALTLNGGSISDLLGNAVNLTLAAPGLAGSLSASNNIHIG